MNIAVVLLASKGLFACGSAVGGIRWALSAARSTGLLLFVLPSLAVAAAGTPEPSPVAPSGLSAATSLLELNGVFAAADTTSQQLATQLRSTNPTVPEAVWSRFAAIVSDHATLASLYAPVYARHLSEAEIQDLVRFYRSPLGNRFRQALPLIAADSRAEVQAFAARVTLDLSSQSPNAGADANPKVGPDARALAVQRLLRESGALRQARASMADMIARLRTLNLQDVSPTFWDAAERRLTDESVLLDLWTPAYVRHLSENDVQELISFYQSATGRRYVEVQPMIQTECVAAAAKLANQAARRAIREVLGPLPQWRLEHPVPVPQTPGEAPAP